MKHCILEGADHDTPSVTTYRCYGGEAPANAQVILSSSTRLVRHAYIKNFNKPQEFKKLKLPSSKIGGWKLEDLTMVFPMPRCLVFPDGRVYLNDVHFKPGFDYYGKILSQVIEDISNTFTGNMKLEDLCLLNRKIF